MELDADFFAARRCLREPIPEIFAAAEILSEAADAHCSGDHALAERLLSDADLPAVRGWTESLWGSRKSTPDQWKYHRFRNIPDAPPHLAKQDRVAIRMPTRAEQAAIIGHYGRLCMFCGIPLVRQEVRAAFNRRYPVAVPWGSTNPTQHAAFQCMWLQFDHLVPHSRGGLNSLENVVVTCAPCNFGRMHHTIEELGLLDPRPLPRTRSTWDGLERIFAS